MALMVVSLATGVCTGVVSRHFWSGPGVTGPHGGLRISRLCYRAGPDTPSTPHAVESEETC